MSAPLQAIMVAFQAAAIKNTLAQGSNIVVSSTSDWFCNGVALTPTKAIAAWYRRGGANDGQGCVLTIVGDAVTAGTILTVSTGTVGTNRLARIDDTHAVWTYYNNDGGGNAHAVLLTQSGNSLSKGTDMVWNSGATSGIRVAPLTSTTCVGMYRGSGMNTKVLTVSGSSLIAGTVHKFTSDNAGDGSIGKMSDTKCACGFMNYSTGSYQYATIISISGTIISSGITVAVSSVASTADSGMAALSETLAVLTYRGASSYANVNALEILGTTITTVGTLAVHASETTGDHDAEAMSATKVVLQWSIGTAGKFIVDDISGTSHRFGDSISLPTNLLWGTISKLDDDKLISVYTGGIALGARASVLTIS